MSRNGSVHSLNRIGSGRACSGNPYPDQRRHGGQIGRKHDKLKNQQQPEKIRSLTTLEQHHCRKGRQG
ncbi:MAG: hypothetical protein L6W00_03210 [Lentisphaeria bacterium]|nr:MAG: hypothetical protein L6W00_03210 [Lentisphaeria bacterium]